MTRTAVSELFCLPAPAAPAPKFRPNRPAAFGCVNFPMNLHNWSKKFHPSGSRRHLGRNFRRQFGRKFCDSVASLPLLSFFFSPFFFSSSLSFSPSLLLFVSSSFFFFSDQVLEQRETRTAAGVEGVVGKTTSMKNKNTRVKSTLLQDLSTENEVSTSFVLP